MAYQTVLPHKPLAGTLQIPGDKSISHRFVMFSSLAEGVSQAENILVGDDCLRTMAAFRAMGVTIEQQGTRCRVHGVGKNGLHAPREALDLGNSGTSIRLLAGLLAGQKFDTTMTGDPSLSKRPMDRVVVPLRKMGARLLGVGERHCPPLTITGSQLQAIRHEERLGSAQVKSAILLAGLYAKGKTTVVEEKQSRDHTERLLPLFGADLIREGNEISVSGESRLKAVASLQVPGDFSSAAFFIVAALIIPGSKLLLKNVSLNPTRMELLHVLQKMGADIQVIKSTPTFEPYGDLLVSASSLKGINLSEERLPFLIDELPILMVACVFAEGKSHIEGAGELRVKETDRIASMEEGLGRLGAKIHSKGDDVFIEGIKELKGGSDVETYLDHRTAMSLIVAGLRARTPFLVHGQECVDTSYPDFFNHLQQVMGDL